MLVDLPRCWREALSAELGASYFGELAEFVDRERAAHAVYPDETCVFRAFTATPLAAVRIVLLGQDPYHGEGQAQGLCFSVADGLAHPPSLRNILRELETDLGVPYAASGDLSVWARRGALLLNTVLTVRAGEAASHAKRGWERFTDAAIRALSERKRPVVFVLWGKPAEQKVKFIDLSRHAVVIRAHPSPLSAHRGFLGTRPFSAIEAALRERDLAEFDFSHRDD